MEPEPRVYKLVVGSIFGSRAGRSALTIQFVQHHFVSMYDPTIEDSYRKQVTIDGETFCLNILDTAGDEEYSALRDFYERECSGILLVYDVTNRITFDGLDAQCDHYCQVRGVTKDKLPIVVCGNKCDCSDSERQVPTSEGQSFADKYGYPFIETSAKTGQNVDEAFFTVVRLYGTNENEDKSYHGTSQHSRPKCVIC